MGEGLGSESVAKLATLKGVDSSSARASEGSTFAPSSPDGRIVIDPSSFSHQMLEYVRQSFPSVPTLVRSIAVVIRGGRGGQKNDDGSFFKMARGTVTIAVGAEKVFEPEATVTWPSSDCEMDETGEDSLITAPEASACTLRAEVTA